MAIINQLTNSSLRKYLPNKVLSGFAQSIDNLEGWLYDDGTGDPWWQGAGATPVRWILNADVYSSPHSSHLTRAPNIYTGLDITPGMWVFSNAEPRAVRIVSIISKTDASIQCIVEDVDRYNTFADTTGSGVGIFSPSSNLIFFELGGDGLPVLNPLPANTDIAVVSQVEARFRVFNPTIENRFFQLNHGFKEGQVLKIDPATEKFVNATSKDVFIAGTVMAVGPGPHYFYLSPSTKIISDLEPGLPGRVGDVIWLDPNTGDRTTVPNESSSALYIKMTKSVPSFAISEIDDPKVYTGTTIKLNNTIVAFEAADFVDTGTIIETINAQSDKHGVTASYSAPPLRVAGTAAYPTATPEGSILFRINGVLTSVRSPSILFGESGQVGWWDVIRSINEQTSIHNIYATFDPFTGGVVLTNNIGGPIFFVNLAPEVSAGENKTIPDMLGIPEASDPGPSTRLRLTRADGGGIIISDVSGTFTADVGIQSAENGTLPLALVVDKSIGSTNNYVVANLGARDALTDLRSGDQVFVQSANSMGEWALFVRTGATWTKISDADSASSDANTFTVELTSASRLSNAMGSVSPGSRVVNVAVEVIEAFDGANVSLTVGTQNNMIAVTDNGNWDLTNVGVYEATPPYVNSSDSEDILFAFIDTSGSTTGRVRVIVSYM